MLPVYSVRDLPGLYHYSTGLLLARTRDDSYTDGPSYATVEECIELVRGAMRAIARKSASRQPLPRDMRADFVDPARIADLKTLPATQWDFRRLIELCREINVASANQCHMSTGFLLRSILNHVAPIFGFTDFAHVAAQYPFARSVKTSIARLQGQGRDGADFHLHQPIRKHETLPTAVQVAFSPELDVLLGEVIRIARESGA